jgi:hypothetical protein
MFRLTAVLGRFIQPFHSYFNLVHLVRLGLMNEKDSGTGIRRDMKAPIIRED